MEGDTNEPVPFPAEFVVLTGARDLYDWFGYWPRFHDAEVMSLHLNRAATSFPTVHTWEMTDEVESQSYYISRKHAVVTFLIDGIEELNLTDFGSQNILFDLGVVKKDSGFELSLEASYGLSGTIRAKQIAIAISPVRPGGRSKSTQHVAKRSAG